jgi:hypothetical protein
MSADASRARIEIVNEEIHAIHFANELYWGQKKCSPAAKVAYYRRQDRLEELRSELASLQFDSAQVPVAKNWG